ncbi:MAG TPA: CusA/CzcA family heavy metal efflux RND transporter [Planctomycetota bacterium]|nr:CusA/CzcA family heavy metal efflux RND transporter [Planctomycetota bacterium]
MLSHILHFSIERRGVVLGLACAVALAGAFALSRLPIDAVPDITNNQVQVNVEIEGLTPLDVERQVTFPIETALAGIEGLEYTRSLSRSGFAQVTAVFADGVDIYYARQQIGERIGEARESLAPGVEPRMGPIATGLGEVAMYAVEFAHVDGVGAPIAADDEAGWRADGAYLTPEGLRLTTDVERIAYLRTVHDWIVRPQLRTVDGIAGVDAIGGYDKQFVVAPDPARLLSYGLTIADVRAAIEANNRSIGAAPIEIRGEGHVVRSDGRVQDIGDLAEIVLTVRDGTPIRVRDVADVAIGRELRTGTATHDGAESVVGTTLMRIGGNSRAVAKAVRERLDGIASSLPPGIGVRMLYDRATLVDATIRTVRNNLVEGAALVIAVLFLLLGNLRGALIAAAVIPLSMLIAAIGMERFGISGNLMSLGALDFGIIVDSAVIIVENCVRRLGARQHELGRVLTRRERFAEVYQATMQVRQATLFGEAIIILVYVPILTLSGIEGKMFHPMAMTVILALAGAFVLSLTVVPALVALLLRGRISEQENVVMRWAKSAYAPVIDATLRWRWFVVASALLIVAATLWLATRLGQEFIPRLDEGDLAMQSVRITSTGIEQSTLMQREVERALLTVPEVAYVFSKTGTAEAAFDPMPPSVSDAFIMLKPRPQWPDPALTKAALIEKVRVAVEAVPGNRYIFTQPIELRFNELLSGVRGDLAVKIFGDSFGDLLFAGDDVASALRLVPGASDVTVESVSGLPSLSISVDRAACARLGLNVADVQDVVGAALGGADAGQVFEGDRRFDIVVRLSDAIRRDLPSIERLPIPLPGDGGDGGQRFVPLSSVAAVEIGEGLNQVSRENGKRRIVVQANVRGRDLGSFVAEAQEIVRTRVPLPANTWIEWGGQFENLVAAKRRLQIVVPVCLALIGVLLFATFGTITHAALVFTGVPLALCGGIVGLAVRGMPFSISAAVGFIALSGVAVLNSLVMVSTINQLRGEGRARDDAIRDGSLMRLRPVLMTALVASLGFVPMAFASGQGAEVQRPLATVVIAGIVSSTLLTLIVLPALYRLVHRADEPAPPGSVEGR